jgi:hypothetical protein
VKLCRALVIGALLSLSGCFVFDNPLDRSLPTVAFQIVVNSATYGGTYAWSNASNAFTAKVNGTPYFIYLWPTGEWCLSDDPFKGPATGAFVWTITPPTFTALPQNNGTSGWTPSSVITSVDGAAGGIRGESAGSYGKIYYPDTLRVTFVTSDPSNTATYTWERSLSESFYPSSVVGTNSSTYATSSLDQGNWIRVTLTPMDSTGTVTGTPVTSAPVLVN